MQEPDASAARAPRPAAIFRAALAKAAAKERAVRARRPDRIQAIAGLTDSDLGNLAAEFERLLRTSSDATAMAASLRARLDTLGPDVQADEVGDA